MKYITKNIYHAILIISIVLIIDQITKVYISSYELHKTIYEFSFFKIKYVLNTGVAFSIVEGINDLLKFVIPFAVLILFVLLINYQKNILLKYAFSLQIAGAIGNFIDRLHKPGVIDFIGVGWWPLFNIADSSIVIGLALLILDSLIKIKNDND
jgi:signal peptidase II|tara:strand:+ start:8650 stop:9111 length:462 start_codon:yes stop_codon:yes gene_type:complete